MLCGRIRLALRTKIKQFKWWQRALNKHCNYFCPTCRHYNRCVKDTIAEIAIERDIEYDDQVFEDVVNTWLR